MEDEPELHHQDHVAKLVNFFRTLSTKQKITLATTIPSLIVVVSLGVLIVGCCFYKHKRLPENDKENDLEVLLI